jgi:type IV pilus assembly protein PilB
VLEVLERELLTRHQYEWLGPLRSLLSRWTFRRGFLDEAAVPARVHLARAAISWPALVRRIELDLDGFEAPPETLEIVPGSVARENVVLPIGWRDSLLVLAIPNPRDHETLEKLQFILNQDIEPVAAREEQIVEAIARYYPPSDAEAATIDCFTDPPSITWSAQPDSTFGLRDDDRPVVKLILIIVSEAVALRATEILFEVDEERLRTGYRIDGEMVERDSLPRRLLGAILTRIRIMAGIPLTEEQEEQIGVVRLDSQGSPFDLRVRIRRTGGGSNLLLALTTGEAKASERKGDPHPGAGG